VAGALAWVIACAPAAARADWLQPDGSYKEIQIELRMAQRDTAGHGDDPARLDSVAVAQLKLAHLGDAAKLFRRVLELSPTDAAARAGLGKLALFDDRPAEAESLLVGADTSDAVTAYDLFAARVRRGEYHAAAEMTPFVNLEGRRAQLERLAERAPYEITKGPAQATVPFVRGYPIVLVRASINGQRVIMAVDTGASDLILDEQAFRTCKVQSVPGQSTTFWTGSRAAVQHAIVQRLDLGGFRIENCPAGVMKLARWSLEVNPQSEKVAGVIGLNLLRKFRPTIDFKQDKLELRRPDAAWKPGDDAIKVPFQIWGESELTVYGSLNQSRTMALVVQSGVPGCGLGLPNEVADEIGVRAGTMSKLVKGAGSFLQGRPWAQTTVPSVSVGQESRDKVPCWIGALAPAEMWRHGVRCDGLLSHDFFRDRRVTIDWAAHQLVFE